MDAIATFSQGAVGTTCTGPRRGQLPATPERAEETILTIGGRGTVFTKTGTKFTVLRGQNAGVREARTIIHRFAWIFGNTFAVDALLIAQASLAVHITFFGWIGLLIHFALTGREKKGRQQNWNTQLHVRKVSQKVQ